jgi:hypothetical protein
MKLDRNINPDGRGKYDLVKMRRLAELEAKKDYSATTSVEALAMQGVVDYGNTAATDFFVIRLKDKYAAPALAAYALAAYRDDPEYAGEVLKLAKLAAESFPQSPT